MVSDMIRNRDTVKFATVTAAIRVSTHNLSGIDLSA